ncbi:antibiotic biosynthesis monooxygenase family protein [Stappia sp. ICDLI1TA098]
MIAVIFEAETSAQARAEYLDLAAELRPLLAEIDGFVSIERFQSLTAPGKVLSLSFWRDEAAIAQWRNLPEHRKAQDAGRNRVFTGYRLRIADVQRDYGMTSREEAPADSRSVHTERIAHV